MPGAYEIDRRRRSRRRQADRQRHGVRARRRRATAEYFDPTMHAGAAAANRGRDGRPVLHAGQRRRAAGRRPLCGARRDVGRGARALEHADHPITLMGLVCAEWGYRRASVGSCGRECCTPFFSILVGLGRRSRTRQAVPQVGRRAGGGVGAVSASRRIMLVYLVDQPGKATSSVTGKATRRGDRQDVRRLRQAGDAGRRRLRRADRPRQLRRQRRAKFNLPGPDIGRRRLQHAVQEAADQADRVRRHDERERPVHRTSCRRRAARSSRRRATAPRTSRRCSAATSSTR